MIPYKIIKHISLLLILIYLASCSTTHEVTRRSELMKPEDLGELSVQTTDGKNYTLGSYTLKDSLLICSGIVQRRGINESFAGSLKLSQIKQIKATSTDWGKTILITGVSVTMLVAIIAVLNNSQTGLRNEVVIRYPSGGGCMSMNNFYENENRPLAGGFTEMLDIKSTDLEKVKYLDVIIGTQTAHFKVINDANRIELQTVDEYPANIDEPGVVIIDLK